MTEARTTILDAVSWWASVTTISDSEPPPAPTPASCPAPDGAPRQGKTPPCDPDDLYDTPDDQADGRALEPPLER